MKPYIHLRRMGTRIVGFGWYRCRAIVDESECAFPWAFEPEPWSVMLSIYFGWFSIDIGITGPIPS